MHYIKITLKDKQIIDYTDEFRTLEEIKELYNKALREDLFSIETKERVAFVKTKDIDSVIIVKNAEE